jgi:hypothetical protein
MNLQIDTLQPARLKEISAAQLKEYQSRHARIRVVINWERSDEQIRTLPHAACYPSHFDPMLAQKSQEGYGGLTHRDSRAQKLWRISVDLSMQFCTINRLLQCWRVVRNLDAQAALPCQAARDRGFVSGRLACLSEPVDSDEYSRNLPLEIRGQSLARIAVNDNSQLRP